MQESMVVDAKKYRLIVVCDVVRDRSPVEGHGSHMSK